jgi:8-hydroxy-5-deazaflavin:NADPH oxidoreductase
VVPVDVGDQTGSEIVAAHAPGARVVKAFNTLCATYIEPDPRHQAGRQVIFYAGDDVDAKATLGSIRDEFGFAPVDIGPLREGGLLMQVNGGPLSGLHVLKQD